MEFMSMIISSVKNLLGKKEVKEIIKYLATATIQHAYNKFNVNQYKYDPIDLKTMVYNHNLNYNDKININDMNGTIDLLNIKRFLEELNQNVKNANVNERCLPQRWFFGTMTETTE